jgi:hypothetical protein
MFSKNFPSQYNGADYKGRRVYNFDGGDDGDSPPPQPTQTSQLTIPEYAQPYMETLLGKAEALTSSPYQTYGGERISQMDPLQQQAYTTASQMTAPGQFDFATGLAGAGGLSSLGAGQQYMMMATSPGAQQAFMSPYMQNVVEAQKAAALRDAQKAQLVGDLGAARQGTYGGARALLAGTERERSLQGTMADIQAKGLQSAYEQAMKNMQFGTTAGLQGAGQATQAAQALGQLGATEQQAGIDLAKFQAQMGADQRQQQQAALDLAYQDFITQQQYPYKQLGFMSDLLRGSADLAGKGGTTVYQAPPSPLSQMAGAGLSAAAIYNLTK